MKNFEKYHRENPQIWEGFVKYANEAKRKGFQNYSAYGIFEILRWHTPITGNDAYKLNNTFRPEYARKLMEEQPEFLGFFRIRELKKIER